MFIKYITVGVLLIIFASLGSALYFLLHDKGRSERMVKALTIRISLSLLLFGFLLLAFAMGWITPHHL